MVVTTIAQFAAELNRTATTLIQQLQSAGVNKSSPEDRLTEADKECLLDFLRVSHGTASGERKKITLTRKSASVGLQADGSGEARTIQVEVRKKRAFVTRQDFRDAPVQNAPAYEVPGLAEGQAALALATQIDTPDTAKMRKVAGAKAREAAAARTREATEAAKARAAATAKAREATETAKALQGTTVSSASASANVNLPTPHLDDASVRRELLNEGRTPKARIAFLSYRREDSSGHAGRLYDRLTDDFGHDQVFMDVDNIPPGEDFVDVIQASVWASSIFLLVIGPHWAKLTSNDGKIRLDDPNDFVRLEISSALERNIRIIPVLVGGARMPDANELPPEIRSITRKQAVELSDGRFRADAARLVKAIQTTNLQREPAL
jgi:TIR domain/Bacterial translation initiation factor IF-2 associated region/Translation initiation factor IF-2, N-terminal region